MNFQSLFSGKNKKNIVILQSAEVAQRVVKVKDPELWCTNIHNLHGLQMGRIK